jgi:HAD superfamily hydrolase (TIGR01509 family)
MAALFDLDGTLIDTEPLHLRAERAALARLGVQELAPDHPRTFGAGIMPGMRMLAERYGFADGEEVFAAYLPQWEAMFPDELRLMPGADAVLRRLDDHSVPCALVTSGEAAYVQDVLARFGWENMFRAVISLESVSKLKPDPEPYLKAAAALGLKASECAGFEDSSPGVRSLKAAGAYAVAVHRDVEARTELHIADERVTSLHMVDDGAVARMFGSG